MVLRCSGLQMVMGLRSLFLLRWQMLASIVGFSRLTTRCRHSEMEIETIYPKYLKESKSQICCYVLVSAVALLLLSHSSFTSVFWLQRFSVYISTAENSTPGNRVFIFCRVQHRFTSTFAVDEGTAQPSNLEKSPSFTPLVRSDPPSSSGRGSHTQSITCL